MKIIVQIFLFIFPWKIRRFLLTRFFNFDLAKSSRIGYSIILAKRVELGEHAFIGSLTFCKGIGSLILKERARLGTLNYIGGYPNHLKTFFSHVEDRNCTLQIGKHSAITSRHFIDCTGGIYIGNFTTFAGIRSQILTHSIDLKMSRQDAAPVKIGNYCFIGTGCVILKGSCLPDFSILGAASLLSKKFEDQYSIYGGVPCKKVRDIEEDYEYFKRQTGFIK